MNERTGSLPAVRITLADGSTVVGGRHSLAKMLELAFSPRVAAVARPVAAVPHAPAKPARPRRQRRPA